MICCHNSQINNLFKSINRELNKGFKDLITFGEERYFINTKTNIIKHIPIKYKYMGYYTNYTLDILKDPDNQEEQFYEEFGKFVGELASDFKNFGSAEAKWYTREDDMLRLSKKFPKMLFKIEGDGEEPLDIWIAHFCNGKCNYREIQTHWEEFDSEEFYNSNKS